MEKYKTKIKCKFRCNNLNINDFVKDENKDFIYQTSHKYKNTLINCNLIIYKYKLKSFFVNGCTKYVKVKGNFENFGIQFILDAERHDNYMDKKFSEIPNIIEYRKICENELAKCKLIIKMGKIDYADIMHYHDKTLPKTIYRKKENVAYKGVSNRPLLGGKFTPK